VSERIRALEEALRLAPASTPLRLLLVELLLEAGRADDAGAHLDALADAGAPNAGEALQGGRLALRAGRLERALDLLENAKRQGAVDGVAALEREVEAALAERGVRRLRMVPRAGEASAPAPAPVAEEAAVTFADVGGLDEVKKTIHRRIVLPFRRPELYATYGRRAGGGVLLFGPPGCGKTLLARATAGECGVPFLNVRMEEVLDPYFGQSERNLHAAFETARAQAPCVLFLDELDAIAYSRRKHRGAAGRPLVDQLLQELDSIGAENRNLLVLAATNALWDVDDALLRPGRFDRLVFVPPPDAAARQEVLAVLLRGKPQAGVDLAALAGATALWSGADLRAMVERAVDRVIEEALESGSEPPLSGGHLQAALADTRPSTLEWLHRAKSYVEFSNQAGLYEDVAAFLRSKEAKAAKRWKPSEDDARS
jgi:SpoVK/Ycf46/Vps4 family AAA+-type ATPase